LKECCNKSLVKFIAAIFHFEEAFDTGFAGNFDLFERSLGNAFDVISLSDGDAIRRGGDFDLAAKSVPLAMVEVAFEKGPVEAYCT